jgi:hypothetical protein
VPQKELIVEALIEGKESQALSCLLNVENIPELKFKARVSIGMRVLQGLLD